MSIGGAVGMAGCSEVTDQLGDDGGNATATPEPEPDPEPQRVYADWLPAPDELGDDDHYSFTYLDMADFEEYEDELDDESFDPTSFEDVWSPLSFDWTDVSDLTLFGGFGFNNIVIEAEFSREDAISDLEDEEYEEDSEYDGYTIMFDSESERAVAVGDGTVVIVSGDESVDTAETLLDTQGGDSERYGEASDDMATLVGELGGGSLVQGRTTETPDRPAPAEGEFENMVARGSRAQINGATTDRTWVVVYESSDDVDTDDLEAWVDANDGIDEQFEDAEDISYSSDGRLGIVTVTGDTDEL